MACPATSWSTTANSLQDERLHSVRASCRRPSIPLRHRGCRRPTWPPERLAKAERNYAMEYIRSGLPRLAELFGPAEAGHLGRITGRLIGAQLYKETAALLDIEAGGARGVLPVSCCGSPQARAMRRHWPSRRTAPCSVRRAGWRLMRGLEPLSPAIFEAWNGLLEGALAVHDRRLVLEVLARRDFGDAAFVWRIRRPR